VYILFISIFFEDHKGLVLMSLYLLGILLSFCFAFLLRQTPYFRRPSDEKVNELPDFRLPHWKSILRHIWFRVSDFLKKISTVVLCASVIIWALEFFPAQDLLHIETSWLASIGHFLEPIMAPLGFDWKMSVCLLTGVPAKEAIAATFAILYGGDVASSVFSPLSAYAFLVFTLLYFPCVATVATLRRETNAFWASVSVINSLLIAWLGAFAVFRIGTLILG
jgi:ferrous iron transport protein B